MSQQYSVIINKKIKYVKVYAILNKIGQKENFLTKLFIKLLTKKEEQAKI